MRTAVQTDSRQLRLPIHRAARGNEVVIGIERDIVARRAEIARMHWGIVTRRRSVRRLVLLVLLRGRLGRGGRRRLLVVLLVRILELVPGVRPAESAEHAVVHLVSGVATSCSTG